MSVIRVIPLYTKIFILRIAIKRCASKRVFMLVQYSDSFMEMMRWGKESPESVID